MKPGKSVPLHCVSDLFFHIVSYLILLRRVAVQHQLVFKVDTFLK